MMKLTKFICFIIITVVFIAFPNRGYAQKKATPQEVFEKIREAREFLSQAGTGLEDFNKKNGPWVFKDTYVFVFDCKKGTILAHAIRPQLIGKNLMGLRDIKGNSFFAQLCAAAQTSSGGWVEYWWPKVGETEPSRKISLLLQVPGTSYQVGAGIYDEYKSIAELNALLK